jgi:ATP-binding cassette subfamily F protein 3
LRQESPVDAERSVLAEAEEARRHLLEIANRLSELEEKLNESPTEDDLEEYSRLHEHFVEVQGYSAERDVRFVLQRMGFEDEELDKPTSALSGGERTRLALARMLLEEPDLLILDEPTNHLDLQATEWLEGWVRSYPGAVLIVSHDRAFLSNTADRILELSDGKVKSYPGPFDKYLKLRADEAERLAEVARRQQEEIAKLDEYVRRFINSQRTAQARGRRKKMEKLVASAVQAPKAEKGIKASIKAGKRSGDIVLDCEKLSMAFGDQVLFENLDWTVRIGERWGVVGENGSGKSTLVKIALSLIEPVEGQAKLGSNVEAGYFSQDADTLDPDQSPLDHLVWECNMLPPDARKLLGRFLISGEDAMRPIRTLSGGEKNKLALATLANLGPNLMVLDEPTNHLDMDSRDALAEVLKEYRGTLILVSHDRWLLDQVTDRTLDLRGKQAIQYPGSYSEYRRASLKKAVATKSKPNPSQQEKPAEVKLSPREISKEIGRYERLVVESEKRIAESEASLASLENTLSNPPKDADLMSLTSQHASIKTEIEERFAEWESYSQRLEELRAMQN